MRLAVSKSSLPYIQYLVNQVAVRVGYSERKLLELLHLELRCLQLLFYGVEACAVGAALRVDRCNVPGAESRRALCRLCLLNRKSDFL